MQAHNEPTMSVREYDILRLNNLLPAGQSITEFAKIMNLSGSTAERLKEEIQQMIDSQGDLNLRGEVRHA